MPRVAFTEGYIRFLMRRRDVQDYGLGNSQSAVESAIEGAVHALNAADYSVALLEPFRRDPSRPELFFRPMRFIDKVYLRHLNRRIRRLYRIAHPNRHSIVCQITSLLKSDTSLRVLKADIRRCFWSIRFTRLVEALQCDGLLEAHELRTIAALASLTARVQPVGLPWGLSISSTLAEIYLRQFDDVVRRMESVYYYQRFVDDMVVFTTSDPERVQNELAGQLAELKLLLNLTPEKTRAITETPHHPMEFTYLGYHFKRPPTIKPGQPVALEVLIAEKKLARLKTRIQKTISQFCMDRSWRDLRDRLRILTGNYKIDRDSHEAEICTGIYFNYREITAEGLGQLNELDAFLKERLMSLRNYIRRRGISQRPRAMRALFRYSFRDGFNKRTVHRVPRSRIRDLVQAWNK